MQHILGLCIYLCSDPIKVPPSGTEILKEIMQDDSSSSEQGKVQIKPLGAAKHSIVITKPEDMLSKKGNQSYSEI
jgi:hypothetical protein